MTTTHPMIASADRLVPARLESVKYDGEYYHTANYAFYEERRDRYRQTAHEIVELLRRLGLIREDSLVLDYGCALGFLIEGLIQAGYRNACGVEISEWARQAARPDVAIYKSLDDVAHRADVVIALDVFEHMGDDDVRHVVRKLGPQALLVRVPCSTDGGKNFHLKISRADPTHVNCKTKEAWKSLLQGLGYLALHLNLYTVYDTAGVACLLGIRQP